MKSYCLKFYDPPLQHPNDIWGSAITSGNYYLIIGGYDGTNQFISVNGGTFVTVSNTTAFPSFTPDLYIGVKYDVSSLFWNGLIQHSFVINRAITQAEALRLAQLGGFA